LIPTLLRIVINRVKNVLTWFVCWYIALVGLAWKKCKNMKELDKGMRTLHIELKTAPTKL